jgi:hypothetical protein
MSEGLNRFFMRRLCSMRLGFASLTKSVIAAVTISYSLMASSHAAAPSANANSQADWCKRLTPRLPSISAKTCQGSALTPTGAVSRKGFPILVRDVLPDAKELAKGGNSSNKEPVLKSGYSGRTTVGCASRLRLTADLLRCLVEDHRTRRPGWQHPA